MEGRKEGLKAGGEYSGRKANSAAPENRFETQSYLNLWDVNSQCVFCDVEECIAHEFCEWSAVA